MDSNARKPDRHCSRAALGETAVLPGDLYARSDAKGLARLAVHAGIAGCTGMLVAASLTTVWSFPVMVLHGAVLAFLFAPLHECIHLTAFESRRLNDVVAFGCGLVLMLPKEYFRAFHLAHHRGTQDPDYDPELAVGKPESVYEYLLHLSGLPYWRERVTMLVRHARGKVTEPYVAGPKRTTIVREARLHLALYLLLAAVSLSAKSNILLLYWLAPVVLGQPFLRAFLLAEHTGCPMTADMLQNSRTTDTNSLVKAISWNMPYHAEHHAWAAVPFHALPKVHDIVHGRIAIRAPGYLSVHREILRNITGKALRWQR